MTKEDDNNKKAQQRALVLQGGGALGAYEAGVFNVLYHWIKKDIKEDDNNKNIFDIVAGTSIGAINAAILVGYVKENNGNWDGASQQLVKFWKHVSSTPILSKWLSDYYDYYKNATVNTINIGASPEALRRYYSAKEFTYTGAQNVFSSPTMRYDFKFFDNFSVPVNDIWVCYDNEPLRESIRSYTKFPIATSFDKQNNNGKKQQPRLLLVSVDVEEGEVVTFDSYEKEDGSRKSEYGFDDYDNGDYCAPANKKKDNKKGKYECTIRYDQGIMAEHVMASASVPEHYDYTLVPKEYDYAKTEEEKLSDMQYYRNSADSGIYRRFWDGGLLSNTPLRELIQAHQDYWTKVKNKDNNINTTSGHSDIPNLEVYIVDVWPSIADYPLPFDLDGIRDRKNDLTYGDKTPYEEQIDNLVSDYYNLTRSLIDLAKSKGATQNDINAILETNAKSTHRTGGNRTYGDLLHKRFDITQVVRIERCADLDDISNKWSDFSSETIARLIRQGISDTLRKLANVARKSKQSEAEGIQAASEQLTAFINGVQKHSNQSQIAEQDTQLIKAAEDTKSRILL